MICPKCGANMTLKKGVCPRCGYDIEINQETRKYSCYFYNRGLEKAKIRDLSGAVDMLKRSIKVNKKNVDARNLLGLVYYEMGETVSAINEWIISRSLLEGNNPAERYLDVLKRNMTKLDDLNNAIRKYNAGLSLAAQGGYDLALIQLKKAVSLNPHFIRAWQLLALVYLQKNDVEHARKCIKRTLRIDIANTTSICYLKEIREIAHKGRQIRLVLPEPEEELQDRETDRTVKRTLLPSYTYEEDRPDYRSFVSLLVGVFLGIMVVYFMIVPGIKKGMQQDFKSTQSEYAEQLSGVLSDNESLERSIQSLQSKLELQEIELEDYEAQVAELSDKAGGVNMFRLIAYYMNLVSLGADEENATRTQLFLLQQRIKAVTEEELANASAESIYESICNAYPNCMSVTMTSTELTDEGKSLYNAEKYSQALEFFEYSYAKSADNEENLYYLARTCLLTKDTESAKKYYSEYTERFPEGTYIDTVNAELARLEE